MSCMLHNIVWYIAWDDLTYITWCRNQKNVIFLYVICLFSYFKMLRQSAYLYAFILNLLMSQWKYFYYTVAFMLSAYFRAQQNFLLGSSLFINKCHGEINILQFLRIYCIVPQTSIEKRCIFCKLSCMVSIICTL